MAKIKGRPEVWKPFKRFNDPTRCAQVWVALCVYFLELLVKGPSSPLLGDFHFHSVFYFLFYAL